MTAIDWASMVMGTIFAIFTFTMDRNDPTRLIMFGVVMIGALLQAHAHSVRRGS